MQSKGFTIFEILITLTIVAILLSIAYPSYQRYLISSYRNQAKIALLDVATKMEKYYAKNNSYKDASLEHLHVIKTIGNDRHKLDIHNVTTDDYTISAIPQNIQEKSDSGCGTLSYAANGKKSISGNARLENCW